MPPKPAPSQVGYSGKPLSDKLGIKPTTIGQIWNLPNDVLPLYGKLPGKVKAVTKLSGANNFVQLFVTNETQMADMISKARLTLKQDGMIWVSWPKKSSGVATDITENTIRDFALAHELVDVKVCAVSEIWSGLKLVIPVAKRKNL